MSEVINTPTAGSRLPAEVPFSGAQSGVGLKPDLDSVAGLSEIGGIYNRPAEAAANDRAFDHGIIAEGHDGGEVSPQGDIPWL
jgi:hypothetical protein